MTNRNRSRNQNVNLDQFLSDVNDMRQSVTFREPMTQEQAESEYARIEQESLARAMKAAQTGDTEAAVSAFAEHQKTVSNKPGIIARMVNGDAVLSAISSLPDDLAGDNGKNALVTVYMLRQVLEKAEERARYFAGTAAYETVFSTKKKTSASKANTNSSADNGANSSTVSVDDILPLLAAEYDGAIPCYRSAKDDVEYYLRVSDKTIWCDSDCTQPAVVEYRGESKDTSDSSISATVRLKTFTNGAGGIRELYVKGLDGQRRMVKKQPVN